MKCETYLKQSFKGPKIEIMTIITNFADSYSQFLQQLADNIIPEIEKKVIDELVKKIVAERSIVILAQIDNKALSTMVLAKAGSEIAKSFNK